MSSNVIDLNDRRPLPTTVCPNCGSDTGQVPDSELRRVTTPDNEVLYSREADLQKLAEQTGFSRARLTVRQLTAADRVPGDICSECINALARAREAVEAGGVYFVCRSCQTRGALQPDNPISAEVRKQTGIEAPEVCGVEFESCDLCTTSETRH